MIFFVAPADGMWGMTEYLEQSGGPLCQRLATITYEELVAGGPLSLGTYVFGGIDQLTPTETEIVSRCCEELTRVSPEIRLLNRPTEVLSRYRLLEACFARGRNTFRVVRASEFQRCRDFPVFVRADREHTGSLTPLLHNRRQLAVALARIVLRGHRLRDLIVVEYCHTADSSGVFRLYCAAVVGDRIVPQALVHHRGWVTKWAGRILDPDFPESLVYEVKNGQKTLVSAMFMLAPGSTLDTAPDIGGALTQWHIHDNLCFATGPNGAARVIGLTDSNGNCRIGQKSDDPVPMIHVWITSHPCGPFAALEGVAAGQVKPGETHLCDTAHGA